MVQKRAKRKLFLVCLTRLKVTLLYPWRRPQLLGSIWNVCGLPFVTNFVWYKRFSVALILHYLESLFLHVFIFWNSVLCSTIKEFIDINSRKVSMIYTQSIHSTSATTPDDHIVPRLLYKVQVLDHLTSFPATMTQQFSHTLSALIESGQSTTKRIK